MDCAPTTLHPGAIQALKTMADSANIKVKPALSDSEADKEAIMKVSDEETIGFGHSLPQNRPINLAVMY